MTLDGPTLYSWQDLLSVCLTTLSVTALLAAYLYRNHQPPRPRCSACNAFLSDTKPRVCPKRPGICR
jgi:hypothetical protein